MHVRKICTLKMPLGRHLVLLLRREILFLNIKYATRNLGKTHYSLISKIIQISTNVHCIICSEQNENGKKSQWQQKEIIFILKKKLPRCNSCFLRLCVICMYYSFKASLTSA